MLVFLGASILFGRNRNEKRIKKRCQVVHFFLLALPKTKIKKFSILLCNNNPLSINQFSLDSLRSWLIWTVPPKPLFLSAFD